MCAKGSAQAGPGSTPPAPADVTSRQVEAPSSTNHSAPVDAKLTPMGKPALGQSLPTDVVKSAVKAEVQRLAGAPPTPPSVTACVSGRLAGWLLYL